MPVSKKMPTLLLTVALALGLAGCGAGTGSAASSEDNTLVVGTMDDLTSMHPVYAIAGADTLYLHPAYETLIEVDPTNMDLLPDAGLASEWGFADGDQTTFEVTIKPDVTFHDGTDLTAEAAKTSLEYSIENGHADVFSTLDEIEVSSDLELTFHLKHPDSAFPHVLTQGAAMIVSPAANEEFGEQAGEHDAGTGPFTFSEWRRGESVVLERYDDYHGGPAALDAIEFRLFHESASLVSALQTRQIHYANSIDPVNLETLDSADHLTMRKEISGIPRLLQFNQSVEPLDDARVRQALNIAIDRQAVIDAVFGTDSGAVPNNQPLPEASWAYPQDSSVEFDQEKAKRLLADAGYPDGFTLEVCSFGPGTAQEADIYRDQFAQIGVTAEITPMPAIGGCVDGLGSGQFGLFLIVWTGGGDPTASVGSLINAFSFGDPDYSEIQAVLDASRDTVDMNERAEILQQIGPLWNEYVPHIFTYTRPNLVAYDVRIEGTAETLMRPDVSGLAFRE